MKVSSVKIDDCWNNIGVWGNAKDKCEKLSDVIHCYNCEVYSNAGRSLLDRIAPEGYDDEWADVLASKKISKNQNSIAAVVFRLGIEWLSLPVKLISQIMPLRNIYDIPHNKNKKIRGIVNIRGEITICMSLGSLLGIDKYEDSSSGKDQPINRLIMIKGKGGYIVFPVSEIDGIINYEPEKLSDAPDTIKHSKLNFIDGVTSSNNKTIGCIDHDKLLDTIANTLK